MAEILVIDDNADIRMVLDRFLTRADHEVAAAASGDEAMKQLEQRSFDLVITDLRMPGVTGIDLVRHIRDRRLRAKIVLMSGGDRGCPESVPECPEAGSAIPLLNKPFSRTDLLSAVDTLLDR